MPVDLVMISMSTSTVELVLTFAEKKPLSLRVWRDARASLASSLHSQLELVFLDALPL
jgi:hypothetical protein